MNNSQINRAMRIKNKYQYLIKTHKPVIVKVNSVHGRILKTIGFTTFVQDEEFEILTKPLQLAK